MDDDTRHLFEQLEGEQRDAGINHIAHSVAQFRDALTERGFERKEAFEMARDFLIELMARTGMSNDDEED